MSYSDSARKLLRDKSVLIQEDLEIYSFDSFSGSWKKTAALNPLAQNATTDGNGMVTFDYPSNFEYEQDAMAASIILTAVDSDNQPITWNFHNNRIDMKNRLSGDFDPALVVLSGGSRLNITPQNVFTRAGDGEIQKSAIGNVQQINVFTSDSPNFTSFEPLKYQTVDGDIDRPTKDWLLGTGHQNRQGRFEFAIRYSYDGISISNFNTSKVLDLIQFGTAKTFFSSTPQGSRLNVDNNEGVVYKKTTGLSDPEARLYRLEHDRIKFYSNPSPGTNLSSMNTSTNRNFLGEYLFKNDVVDDAKGLGLKDDGTKSFVLTSSSTTHPPRTLVEYDIDTPYDITTMKFRSSQYNDIKIGSKNQIRDNGKYLYSLRYQPYAFNSTNTAYVNNTEGYGSNNFSITKGRIINVGGFDWPLAAYIYRYDLEKDYTSAEAGTIYSAPFECNKTYDASDYDYQKTHIFYGYPNYNQRTFSGGSSIFSSTTWYYPHRGPVVGFDMTDGNNLYLITTKGYDRGHLVHKALGTQWDPTSETAVNTISHTIGTQAGNQYFLANFKTNGVWDVKINNDGTAVYILDTNTLSIYQYDMTSPHDLSTLNRTELAPIAKTIDANGYDKILSLSALPATASSPPRTFDSEVLDAINITGLNTASRQNATQPNFFRDFSMIRSFNFNNDGSRLYINNDHRIYQYNLSTAFDIGTALFVGSTEKYRVHMEDKHQHIGVGHYIDSTNQKLYIGNERYEFNKENQGVIREFNLTDSIGSGVQPFKNKIHAIDSDGWSDVHMNDSANRIYLSAPNKIKVLNLDSAGIISGISVESNYTWDSAEKFSGTSITSNTNETDFYVADSSKTIRMITLGNNDSIISVGKSYTTVAPSTENTVLRGMQWFDEKNFIVAGNNRVDHFKSRDSFQVADI